MRFASIFAVSLATLTVPIAGLAQAPAPAPQQPPPTQSGPLHHVPGGVSHVDNWDETAARPAGKRARGFLKPVGGSAQAISFDIVDILTCIFCVVPPVNDPGSKGKPKTAEGRDAASGLATGQRQHQRYTVPLTEANVANIEQEMNANRPGTLTFRARTVGRCVAEARYPSMQLRLDGKDYNLGGVTVVNCAAVASGDPRPIETISISYQTIKFR